MASPTFGRRVEKGCVQPAPPRRRARRLPGLRSPAAPPGPRTGCVGPPSALRQGALATAGGLAPTDARAGARRRRALRGGEHGPDARAHGRRAPGVRDGARRSGATLARRARDRRRARALHGRGRAGAPDRLHAPDRRRVMVETNAKPWTGKGCKQMDAEHRRLEETRTKAAPWQKWGPYLSERQWGTVREDYSDSGNAWDYFSHDQARSRAYRWGEDGLAGISDDEQLLCFGLALWNGKDPILKERLFGLTNGEGNHGEDVKEYYFYLDSTPTHSYMKYLYKYPQRAFPYDDLVKNNRKRTRNELEYELIDTGIFEDDRYFDVFVEYAKEKPENILVRITIFNRGSEPATLDLLPTLWFRNVWSRRQGVPRPVLQKVPTGAGNRVISASHPESGERFLYCDGAARLLFTENETNKQRLFQAPNPTPYVKDGINDYIVDRREGAVNPQNIGTKAAAHYRLTFGPGQFQTVRLRLSDVAPPLPPQQDSQFASFATSFDVVMQMREREADTFY